MTTSSSTTNFGNLVVKMITLSLGQHRRAYVFDLIQRRRLHPIVGAKPPSCTARQQEAAKNNTASCCQCHESAFKRSAESFSGAPDCTSYSDACLPF